MASEYFKWLARDVKPEQTRELTREEKWKNWWYYHKIHVIVGIVCALMLGSMVHDMVTNARNVPDYQIAYVGTTALPDDTVKAVELAIAELGEDLNGNGKVQVRLQEYLLEPESSADENSAQRDYNTTMLLTLNIETLESMIFLLEDPEDFAGTYPILTPVRPGGPLYHRWGDCPVLASLPLGSFEFAMPDGMHEGDSQTVLADFSIACRGIWNTNTNETIDGALRLFEVLTEGAK